MSKKTEQSSTHLSYHVRLLFLGLAIGIFSIGVPLIILYSLGYRLNPKQQTVSGTGGIYVHKYEVDGKITLDGAEVSPFALFEKNNLIQGLQPGAHRLEIRALDYIPWTKTLTVGTQKVTSVSPFLVPVAPKITILTEKTASKAKAEISYAATLALFNEKPTESVLSPGAYAGILAPLGNIPLAQKRNILISKTKNALYATWTGEPSFTPQFFCNELNNCAQFSRIYETEDSTLSTLLFYPARDDVLIGVFGKDVRIFELDTRGGQNNHVVYSGSQTVTIRKVDDTHIAIKDGKKLLILALESSEF